MIPSKAGSAPPVGRLRRTTMASLLFGPLLLLLPPASAARRLSGMSMSMPSECDCERCPSAAAGGATAVPDGTEAAASAASDGVAATTTTLKVLTVGWKSGDVKNFLGPMFEAHHNNLFNEGKATTRVRIDETASLEVPGFDALFAEIEDDARLGLELFDVYLTPPTVLGSVVPYDGFADMTQFVTDNYLSEWLDIYPGYRENIATYNGRILMMPFDGDLLHLYYNKEILEHYNLTPPRTWDEYNDIAGRLDGEVFPPTNRTMVGSCVGRLPQCAGPYWASLVLSSMTQARGSYEGSLFDTKDMQALTGEALEETLRILEGQFRHGPDNELDGCIEINSDSMENDQCALTYNWGNSFTQDIIRGKLGIAKTPGSQRVLDRETGALVPCDVERCPHATYYEDIGFVNHVPYAAFGGWSGAVSANIPLERKKLAMEFLAFTASKEESRKVVIPPVGSNMAKTGFDPFRQSHSDLDAWLAQGYGQESTRSYLDTIREALQSPNLAIDIRFPRATQIMSVLDQQVIQHLNGTRDETNEGVLKAKRAEVAKAVTSAWSEMISDYDGRGDTIMPIHEQYQRLRGVYVNENQNLNLIGDVVRTVGWALGGLIMAMSLACFAWVTLNRKHRIVKASQPLFLDIILAGVVVMSSAIFPLGVDDSFASIRGCDVACASIPWLVSIGFSFVFAALFAKLWRINRVFRAAKSMKRVVVKEKDVLRPFLALVTLNVALLTGWTATDPMRWVRVQVDELNSYGRCSAEGNAWKGFLSVLGLLNFAALIIANVEAYRARAINDELAESKYIGLTTLTMTQTFIVVIPLLVIVQSNPPAYFFVWTGSLFIISSSILSLIFAPKVWRMMNGSKNSINRRSTGGSIQVSGLSTDSGAGQQSGVVRRLESNQSDGSEPAPVTPTTGGSLERPMLRVSFSEKNDEQLFFGDKEVDTLTALVLAEHNVDIAPLITKMKEAEGC